MDISEKIILLMKERNISNSKVLARLAGIPYTTLKNILDRNVKDVRLSTATKLCDFFNITYDELFSDKLSLPEIKVASYGGIDVEGLDVTDIKEINDFIRYVKSKKEKK